MITASLTDPDGSQNVNLPVTDTAITTGVTWTWAVSEVVQGSLMLTTMTIGGLRLEPADLEQTNIHRMLQTKASTCG